MTHLFTCGFGVSKTRLQRAERMKYQTKIAYTTFCAALFLSEYLGMVLNGYRGNIETQLHNNTETNILKHK